MSDSAAALKSGVQAKKPVSEAKLWLVWVAVIVVWAAISTAWGRYKGIDVASAAYGSTGGTIGVILGLGAMHLVSRRFGYPGLFVLLNSAAGTILFPVTMGGLYGRPFTFSFVGCFFTTVVALSVVAAIHDPLMRFLKWVEPRRSKKAAPPQSDHLLYDAHVDGAT